MVISISYIMSNSRVSVTYDAHQSILQLRNKFLPLADTPPHLPNNFTSGQSVRHQEHPEVSLRKVEGRGATFRSAGRLKAEGKLLARAGFYYSGRDDVVVCAYCGGTIHRRKLGEDPLTGHARYFPGCGYVKERVNKSSDGEKNSKFDQHFITRDFDDDEQLRKELDVNILALTDKIVRLREENERLRRERICLMCGHDEVSVVLFPCNHLVSCKQCSHSANNCPKCNATVLGKVSTFFA